MWDHAVTVNQAFSWRLQAALLISGGALPVNIAAQVKIVMTTAHVQP